MSQEKPTGSTESRGRHGPPMGGGPGGPAAFAGVLLMLVGVLDVVQGLVAVTSGSFFTVKSEYLSGADPSGWGWAHLVLGIAAAVAGAALFRGADWARGVAVIVATIGMFVNFLWIPYYPAGAIVLVGMNIFVMWAAFAHTRDIL